MSDETQTTETPRYEAPTPNLPLLRKVLDHIDAHPEEWNQMSWARNFALADGFWSVSKSEIESATGRELCDTAYCIAGHAVAMTEGIEWTKDGYGTPASGADWYDAGARALGIESWEAAALFDSGNDRTDVQAAAERIAARAGERL